MSDSREEQAPRPVRPLVPPFRGVGPAGLDGGATSVPRAVSTPARPAVPPFLATRRPRTPVAAAITPVAGEPAERDATGSAPRSTSPSLEESVEEVELNVGWATANVAPPETTSELLLGDAALAGSDLAEATPNVALADARARPDSEPPLPEKSPVALDDPTQVAAGDGLAAVLEDVARRVRAGELKAGAEYRPEMGEPAALALVLAAMLGAGR